MPLQHRALVPRRSTMPARHANGIRRLRYGNVLFGSLQRISSEQLELSPTLMGAANSSGGLMGKMIDAQSIVVAATATNYYGQEGVILDTSSSIRSR
jgi:L-lactate permease